MNYYYGASIQGIQGFIFATNKLQEIIGASEIVKNINEKFEKKFENDKDVDIILNAAGNIKAVFKNKETLQNHILNFEKEIRQKAYGITISQAVIKTDNTNPTDEDRQKLEKKLKTQRNKPSIPLDLSLNITELAPSTAKPIYKIINKGKNEKEKIDKSAYQKRERFKKLENQEIKDISQLSNKKNKIAVIHIDGNGLGKLLPELKDRYKIELKDFSKELDSATKKAFEVAKQNKTLREVILGGDDVTVIINGDEALEFTKVFLEEFEKNTKKYNLTACAGISYCNENYPFHYAVNLAEELCKEAKDRSKREKSCLMFHNIQSSFIDDFEMIKKNELKVDGVEFDFGPYYLNDIPKIDDFLVVVNGYKTEGSPISKIREWIGELDNKLYANKLLNRINQISKSKGWKVDIMDKNLKKLHKELRSDNLIVNNKTPIYDVLQIISISKGL